MLSSFSLSAQSEWVKYHSDKGEFSIDAPSTLKDGIQTINTAVGLLEVHTLMVQGGPDDPNHLYLLNYTDYPKDTFSSDSTEVIKAFFDSTIESTLESLGGLLIYTSDSQLEGHPGLLFRIKYNEGNAIVKGKIFLVGDRFYSLQVFTLTDQSLNDEMNIFLDSFRLK